VTTLLNEVEDIDLYVRFDFLGFTILNPWYRLIRSLFNRAELRGHENAEEVSEEQLNL
jgi:hypothetical protein